MRKILVLGQSSFIQDLEVTVLTVDVTDLEFGYAVSIEQAVTILDKTHWDEFIVFAGFLDSLDLTTIDVPVTSYARNAEGLKAAVEEQVKSYGIVNRASELLKNISNQTFVKTEAPEAPVRNKMPSLEKVSDGGIQAPEMANTSLSDASEKPLARQKESPETRINSMFLPYGTEKDSADEDILVIPLSKKPVTEEAVVKEPEKTNDERKTESAGNDVRSRLAEIRRQKEAVAEGTPETRSPETIPVKQKKTQVITVYSAKGGVGKTTTACNLATFLALTASGRDHFKVVVIDFDLDFGDVLSTVGFDTGKVCMTAWAKDVKERISDGEKSSEIRYSQTEIRSFMQKKKESGLYGLLAPITSADAMDIGEEEIKVMLRNTVENGGFDYVIVDTGSNICDASIIPIEMADIVLMVLTQNLNTAYGCSGFIRLMHELKFDMGKLKLVINEIRPGKAVGITVSELEEVMIDPSSGKAIPCIGKLNDDNDVRASVNDMVPLVYNAKHEYTKAIGQLAAEIIGEEHVLEAPKKKGLFKRFKKKSKE
ncbi:MAG: AAA family ATPase [Lachnospiraceae bacterium]|nr:AAA family ATPase [Lachnospiraceae bacterium]